MNIPAASAEGAECEVKDADKKWEGLGQNATAVVHAHVGAQCSHDVFQGASM